MNELKKLGIMKANELSIGWAMKQQDPVAAVSRVFDNVRRCSVQQILKARSAAAALLPSIVLFTQVTLCVAFAFGLMFFAAILQG